ncbi:MAG: helix-turn-helix domain-containing protein [Candidatus Omnitrophota bacterium]
MEAELKKRKLLKAGEMAELLGVPKSWIYQRTMQGQEAIPHIKMGMYVRFDPDEVLGFFKTKGKQPA